MCSQDTTVSKTSSALLCLCGRSVILIFSTSQRLCELVDRLCVSSPADHVVGRPIVGTCSLGLRLEL